MKLVHMPGNDVPFDGMTCFPYFLTLCDILFDVFNVLLDGMAYFWTLLTFGRYDVPFTSTRFISDVSRCEHALRTQLLSSNHRANVKVKY